MPHIDLTDLDGWESSSALTRPAADLKTAAAGFQQEIESTAKAWSGLEQAYRTPDADILCGALVLPCASATVIEGAGRLIERTIATFAATLATLEGRRTRLRSGVSAFHGSWEAQPEGELPPDALSEYHRLTDEHRRLKADYSAATSTCADDLRGVTSASAVQETTFNLLGFAPWPGWGVSNGLKSFGLVATDVLQRAVTTTIITDLLTSTTTTRYLPWLAGKPGTVREALLDLLLTHTKSAQSVFNTTSVVDSVLRASPGGKPLFEFDPSLLRQDGQSYAAWLRGAPDRFMSSFGKAFGMNIPVVSPLRDYVTALQTTNPDWTPTETVHQGRPLVHTDTSFWRRTTQATAESTAKQVATDVVSEARFSTLGKVAGSLGVVGDVAGAYFTFQDERSSELQEELQQHPGISREQAESNADQDAAVRTAAKTATGILAGAVGGAAAGSVVPGAGTVVGFVGGLAVGLATEIDFIPDRNGNKQSVSDVVANGAEWVWNKLPWGH